ncbi:alpha-crystallin A chain-like [Anticarsia gemmatalis]|uniref:alpha-crystallin A chain-like n=1 Tax=Anticarsia gemmatalis TaxID=129554 RepID=UPI003F76637B
MFSSRSLAALAVLATVAALPATDRPIPQPITTVYSEDFENPWLTFPLFGNLFAPLWKLFPSFADIGPRIIADDNKFEVIVNVKDYKKDDLKVKVKGDFIFIQGSHEAKQDDRDVFASQFFHTYTLPANASGADVTAKLTTDGNLIVEAPVSGPVNRAKEVDREVPIEETGKPLAKEEKPDKSGVTPAVPAATTSAAAVTTTEVDDRKEPTTPSSKEDVTEKDNVIPHGNEVQL